MELCSKWLGENEERFLRTSLITVPQNTGIASNCNRGLAASTGEWIKLIAGDDVLLDDCVADNLEYAASFPKASFVVSDVQEIDEKGALLREKSANEGLVLFANIPSVEKQLKAYSRWPVFLNSPTFFCKKEVLEKIGCFDEEFKIYEDMCMIYRILNEGIRVNYLNKTTVKYRIHQKSISRDETIDDAREKEAHGIFKKYRVENLSFFNPLDLSVHYESWLRFNYKGFNGRKGLSVLLKFSLFYWYLRLHGIKKH